VLVEGRCSLVECIYDDDSGGDSLGRDDDPPLDVGIERLRAKQRSASDDVARAARGATKRRTWTSWFIEGFEETVEEGGGHAGLGFVLAQDSF
jgi:hypothetical protein